MIRMVTCFVHAYCLIARLPVVPTFSWNGLDGLTLAGFWPNDGAIEQVSIVGIASRSTPVPESSSLALLVLGIGVLSWSRRHKS